MKVLKVWRIAWSLRRVIKADWQLIWRLPLFLVGSLLYLCVLAPLIAVEDRINRWRGTGRHRHYPDPAGGNA